MRKVKQIQERSYKLWQSMRHRLMDREEYKDVTMCAEWETYEGFLEWFNSSEFSNCRDELGNFYFLDKDVLGGQRRLYSPETCAFIPQQLNNMFKRKISSMKAGVQYLSGKAKPYRAYINYNRKHIHLGYYLTEDEAHSKFLEARKECLKNFIEVHSGRLDERVVDRISVMVGE